MRSSAPRLTVFAAVATALATTALSPLFQGYTWMLPAGVAVVLVALSGTLARRWRMGPLGGLLLSAVLVLDWVTVRFAPQHAHLGFVPSLRTFSDLHALLTQAGADIGRLAAPVPALDGITLLTTLAVAGIAYVVDTTAVALRRPAVCGLPFLAMFAVASGLSPHGVGPVPFLLAAGGWLTLLLAEHSERVSRWGRPVAPGLAGRHTPGDATPDSPLASAGRRIGAAALGIALVVPVVVPGLDGLSLTHGDGFGDGQGGSITTFNPLLVIRADLNRSVPQPLLVVRSSADPGYLRMTTLDRFDGETWASSALSQDAEARVSNGIPPSAELAKPGTTVTSRIDVVGLAVHWLPVPFPLESVDVHGDWRYDPPSGTVFSAHDDTGRLRYTTVSRRPILEPATLRAAPAPPADLHRYTRVPDGLPGEIGALAATVTAGAQTPYDQAVKLQEWLRSPPFTYDESVGGGDSGNAIVAFLHAKRGFCVQYAATMAVMARTLGIPARVAVGFTSGTVQANGSRLVTTRDAHAWPELYFAGTGWLRFEPTPRGDGRAAPPDYSVPPPPSTSGQDTPGSTPSSQPSSAPSADPRRDKLERLAGRLGGGTGATQGGGGVPWRLLLVLLAVGCALALPALARVALRRVRWARAPGGAGAAHAAWAELRDDSYDLGLPWRASDSPRGTADRLADAARLDGSAPRMQEARAALTRIARAEERARYAAVPPDASSGELRRDVGLVRQGLAARRTSRRRVLATALPPSTLRRVGVGVLDLVDAAFGAADAVGLWLRRRASALVPSRLGDTPHRS